MTEYKYSLTNQKVYYKELKCGLKVFLIPNAYQKHYYVNISCTYGSDDINYISAITNEEVMSPLGIAHFLEHKVFEMPDGTDPFTFFSKTGTNVNAGTSYYSTKFYMWGTNNLNENLEYFLNMLFNPSFTEKNILKEQGIIAEEIKMYDDDPAWQLEDTIRRNLFHDSYVKEQISGSIESIKSITKEDLYDAYKTFYQPNNMVMVIGGDINQKEIFDYLDKSDTISKLKKGKEIIRKKINEDNTVKEEYQALEANIIVPKLKYAFKIDTNNFTIKDKRLLNIYLNCIFSVLFGTVSDFYEKTYLDELTTGYYYEHSYYDNFYILSIEAESDKADLFKDAIDDCLKDIVITEEDIERQKKMWIASEIRLGDHVDVLVDSLQEENTFYGKPNFERVDLIKSMNKKDLDKVIKELDLSNSSFVLMLPKERKIS